MPSEWVCSYCGREYAEYVNGCPACQHAVVLKADVAATQAGRAAAQEPTDAE